MLRVHIVRNQGRLNQMQTIQLNVKGVEIHTR